MISRRIREEDISEKIILELERREIPVRRQVGGFVMLMILQLPSVIRGDDYKIEKAFLIPCIANRDLGAGIQR